MQLEAIAAGILSRQFGITCPDHQTLLGQIIGANNAGITDSNRTLLIQQADQLGNQALSEAITRFLECPEAYLD